jgi:sugar lactone lactonase YvrE
MEKEERSGFAGWLSKQSLALRILVFSFFVVLAIGLIFAATGLLYYFNVRNYPRIQPVAVAEDVVTTEFASLPDADSYPAALVATADGTLYTGSFVSGVVWQIAPDGSLSEIAGSREQIGSVISLEYADGIYVLDQLAALNSSGTKLWRIDANGLSLLHDLPEIAHPNDVTLDDSGRVYISDLQAGIVYRLDEAGLSVWWQAPNNDFAPAGLAHANGRILISDALRGEIFAIPTTASDTEAERATIFASDVELGFNGMSMGANGKLYVADLLNNEVWEMGLDGVGRVLAGYYRGSSNVAYDASRNRIFVNNWDQSWLLPQEFFVISFTVEPRLPFSIDVIEFG